MIRHRTSDLDILMEIFGWRLYRMPAAVQAIANDIGRPLVVDLGSHVGLFGLWIRDQIPGCRVVGYEADPANHDLALRCLAARSRMEGAGFEVLSIPNPPSGCVMFWCWR